MFIHAKMCFYSFGWEFIFARIRGVRENSVKIVAAGESQPVACRKQNSGAIILIHIVGEGSPLPRQFANKWQKVYKKFISNLRLFSGGETPPLRDLE